MGNEIRIKTVREGMGDVASMGTVVLCNLKGYLLEQQQAQKQSDGKEEEEEVVPGEEDLQSSMVRRLSDPVDDEKNARFVIGEGDTIPALELALRHAKRGEVLLVQTSPKFAYGPAGRSIGPSGCIPGDARLEFEVEVLDHLQLRLQRQGQQQQEEKEGEEEAESERGRRIRSGVEQEVLLRKECGNRWYSYGDFQRAGRAYSKGAEIAEAYLKSITSNGGEGGGEQEEEVATNKSVFDAYVACLNNLSACHISNSDFFKAKEVCISVLQLEPTNIKALLRAARASLALHDYEECEACLNKVCELEPGNSLAIKEKDKLRNARKNYAASNAQISRNMAKGLFKDEAKGKNATSSAAPSPSGPTLASPVGPTSPCPTTESDKSPKNDEDTPESADLVSSQVPSSEEKLSPSPTASTSNTFLFLALSVVTLLFSISVVFFSQRSKKV